MFSNFSFARMLVLVFLSVFLVQAAPVPMQAVLDPEVNAVSNTVSAPSPTAAPVADASSHSASAEVSAASVAPTSAASASESAPTSAGSAESTSAAVSATESAAPSAFAAASASAESASPTATSSASEASSSSSAAVESGEPHATSTAPSTPSASAGLEAPNKWSKVCGQPGRGTVSHDETKATHVDPKEKGKLFAAAKDRFDVEKTMADRKVDQDGDFGRGFYMTDTFESAAQRACHLTFGQKWAVAVFEYEWDPQDSLTYAFGSKNDEWKAFALNKKEQQIRTNDMIAGPINTSNKKNLSSNTWQYVITKQDVAKRLNLKKVTRKIMCKDVPKGDLC
ncbi:hypothetical protein C8J56DRAFT_953442 [Mycena floridula]|nr:hypothetical protein C8J56DRAFT_953442 [Mycena floridula]